LQRNSSHNNATSTGGLTGKTRKPSKKNTAGCTCHLHLSPPPKKVVLGLCRRHPRKATHDRPILPLSSPTQPKTPPSIPSVTSSAVHRPHASWLRRRPRGGPCRGSTSCTSIPLSDPRKCKTPRMCTL
ncbi:unnamed protein product, partial [Ectocarpus sp. 12 AP-2014]